jgi:DNA-binding NarL/FixJ family response regulator
VFGESDNRCPVDVLDPTWARHSSFVIRASSLYPGRVGQCPTTVGAPRYHLLQVFDFCFITTQVEKKNRSRVFIVDDHPVVRDGLKNLIEQEEDLMVCGEAADAASALKTIPQESPDIALVDLSLEHSSGLELVKDIRNQYPELPVIVLSMHDELVYGERAVRSGARGYLMKGESSQRVISAIRSVLQGEVFLSERLMAQIASRLSHAKTTRPPIERLSDRELEVFQMLGQGTSTTAIAEKLNLSVKTVQMYVARAKEKFGVTSARELMREAVRWDEAQVR